MNNKLFDIKYMDLDLKATEKFSAISHLAALAADRLINLDNYIEDVKSRESLSTTGIGDGIAIPHAKSKWVKTPTVIVGKSKGGIEWESLDDNPVKIVFLLAIPDEDKNDHLKILQTLSISLMDDEFKKELDNVTEKSVLEKLLLDITSN
ncbi:MAG: PTS sugar transporter subunit IIA [Oscillospiraceae bacterium]